MRAVIMAGGKGTRLWSVAGISYIEESEPLGTAGALYFLKGEEENFVNAGIYCVSPEALTGISSPIYTDQEKTVISNLIGSGKVFAYRSVEYVKDMGTPDRLRVVSSDIENGIVAGRSLRMLLSEIFVRRQQRTHT